MRKAACRIVEKLRLHGCEAFFAGGWVRDFILRRRPKDIDIATSALPDEVLRLFPHSRMIGARFGVVQVPMYGHTYEVTTFRSDNDYRDGRHPGSVVFSSPEQDAFRRDFTINGLFYDPVAGRLIDYVHGRNDLQAKLIRTIGDPSQRFSEDKLRMLRAVRLACMLGFRIVPETWNAIQKLAPGIRQISWERIRDELTRIFTAPSAAAGLDLLHGSGLLLFIMPEIEAMRGIPESPEAAPQFDVFTHTRTTMSLLRKPSTILAFGTLLHDVGKPVACSRTEQDTIEQHTVMGAKIAEEVCRRLKMSNEEISRVVDLVATHGEFSKVREMRESALKRFLRRPHFADHLELYRVNCLSKQKNLETYNYCLSKFKGHQQQPAPIPLISGEDLIDMGYSPGPLFKVILESIEDLQLEGTVRTREEALAHVKSAFPKTEATQPRSRLD
jgi:poly(A) polymerase